MPTMPNEIMEWLIGQGGALILVLARTLGLAWTAPGWGTAAMGARMRLALALVMAVVLTPAVGPGLELPENIASLGRMLLAEAAVGAALGISAALVVAGARQAGEIVGGQAGMSAAALIDPEAGEPLNPLGHLYGLVALVTFLVLDGPLRLASALVDSYRVLPAGGPPLSAETVAQAFGRVGQALELSLRAAAPVALALAAAGLALGLLTRAAPTLQLGGLALPVRSALGLLLVLLGLVTLAATLTGAWTDWPLPGMSVF